MILCKAKASVIGQMRITGAFLFLKAVILTVLNLNGEDRSHGMNKTSVTITSDPVVLIVAL